MFKASLMAIGFAIAAGTDGTDTSGTTDISGGGASSLPYPNKPNGSNAKTL